MKIDWSPWEFLGEVVLAIPTLFTRRGRRWNLFGYYFEQCGVNSLGIVLLISLLMGMVLALQGLLQLTKVGTEIFLVDLVGFSILKELGPLMVGLIATGRAGSAFAAEIGTMKVNEEISALSTMGINPHAYLVFPKLLAMMLAMPLLTVFGDAAGIAGGMVLGTVVGDIPLSAYWLRTINVLTMDVLLEGVVKSVVFAVLITLSGCFCGFNSSGDAQGVGRGATRAVVISIFMLVISDTVMTLITTAYRT